MVKGLYQNAGDKQTRTVLKQAAGLNNGDRKNLEYFSFFKKNQEHSKHNFGRKCIIFPFVLESKTFLFFPLAIEAQLSLIFFLKRALHGIH